nr:hypothetical protein [Pedobacter panaciterrae]
MKKYYILIAFTLLSSLLFGQTNFFPLTGAVGIGTLNPLNALHVYTNSDLYGIITGDGANSNLRISGTASGAAGYGLIQTFIGGSDKGGVLSLQRDAGNVGIGTAAPQSILHIVSDGSNIDVGNSNQYNKGLIIEGRTGGRSANIGAQLEFVIPANTDGVNPWGQGRIITVAGNSLNGNAVGKMIIGTRRMFDKKGTGQQWFYGDDIVIDGVGNVGIGTLNPKEKLSINGKIRAQEIKVETANWPDYVFAKDYQLPTLQEIEKHIKEKGHLPGIPSAEEVKVNGVDLGEMNAKLLKKIEELMLYMIELEKKNERQDEKINKLTLEMTDKNLKN